MLEHHTSQPTAPSLLSHHRTSATKWFLAQFDRRPKVCSEAGWPEPFRGALMEPELHHSVCWHFAFPAPLLNLVIAQFRGSRFLHYAHQPGWRCFAGLAPGGGGVPSLAGGPPAAGCTCVSCCSCPQLLRTRPQLPVGPTTTTISSTRHSRPVAYFVLLGLRSLGFYFLCRNDHSSRHCDGNLTVNLLPTLFLCSRLSDKKGCFNRSFYFTGSES